MASRILIVEDEQIIAADLQDKLRRMGHQVVGMAIAGEEAIGMADQLKPDLVLMDIQIEGEMRGTEAARKIQERTGAPIIFITAFPSIFLRETAQTRQAGICLGKPFSRIQLEVALRAALRH
jgi:DNA-binding response OmpR family regulator